MQPIDKPFRFSWDFCIVWALLFVPVSLLARHLESGPWYSFWAFTVLGSLYAVFIVYGPVLFMQQVVRSGSRGWFVLRAFLSIIVTAIMLLAVLYCSGCYTEERGHIFACLFTFAATGYLSWRTECNRKSPPCVAASSSTDR